MRTPRNLIAGQKKDIVISRLVKPTEKRVVIFGWYRNDGPDVFDDKSRMDNPKRQPIQPLSDVHGSWFVDYSHGVRLVHPIMTLDAPLHRRSVLIEDVLSDPKLAPLLSHEGSLGRSAMRYPSTVTPKHPEGGLVALEEQGIARLLNLRGGT